jgi:beta-lactam-binding protein with PASTA domain
MAARLSLFVPRFAALTIVALLATTTLTFAATNGTGTTQPQAAPTPSAPKVLVVPDVRNQVYVFAKGTLEESGFAWKVVGSVAGYSANRVVAQTPAPGTRVIDTGAPTISLSLTVNRGYPQQGEPENESPFRGTGIVSAHAAANRVVLPKAKPKKQAVPKRKAPKRKAPKKKAPAVRPKARPKAKAKPKAKGKRPAAFAVPGGRPEPQHELALPERARRLAAWLSGHREATNANVSYWLYQHAWIVEGARFGWWHGAEALETLVRVDRRVQSLWGIGAKSEAVARAALTEVRAKSR